MDVIKLLLVAAIALLVSCKETQVVRAPLVKNILCSELLIKLDSSYIEERYSGFTEAYIKCNKTYLSKSDSFTNRISLSWYYRDKDVDNFVPSDHQNRIQLKKLAKNNLLGKLRNENYTLRHNKYWLYENIGIRDYIATVDVILPDHVVEVTFNMKADNPIDNPTRLCKSIVGSLEAMANTQ